MLKNLLMHSLRSFKRQRAYIIINILWIALITISYRILRAASVNPAQSLKYE
jgi:hypothetical protein